MKNSPKNKLSTDSYRGVRDFYPEDMFLQNYIFETMRLVVESFGYSEYSASLLEPAELYEAKSGQEIVNEQTYTFTDRGDRRITLRPEMTPTAARLVAARKRELSFPLRWYSIPNVFRYERPQKGRLREHWQLNCDIFGVPGIEADIEIIQLAAEIMDAFGAQPSDFEIRVNNRKNLLKHFEKKNLTDEQREKIFKLLDKKDKIDDFDKQMDELVGAHMSVPEEPDSETKELLDQLKKQGVTNACFAPTLVRGFDYYSGTVFEVFDTSPQNNRSLFGGGRYDSLLDIFGTESVPAVGFGMGDVTIQDFLETHDLSPHYTPSTDLYIATQTSEHIEPAQTLARELRERGVSVGVNLLDKKVGEQIKTAVKQFIPFLVVMGEQEIQTNRFTLKELASGKEKIVDREQIAEAIWSEGVEA